MLVDPPCKAEVGHPTDVDEPHHEQGDGIDSSQAPARGAVPGFLSMYRKAGNYFELVDFLKLCLLDIAQGSPSQ